MVTKTSLEARWGAEVMAHGWVAIPTALLLVQGQLKLSANAMNVLLHLFSHWWGDGLVYPSQVTIATKMGVSKRTVQRAIAELLEAELIGRSKTKLNSKFRGRNVYDLSPLVQKVKSISKVLKPKKSLSPSDEDVGDLFQV